MAKGIMMRLNLPSSYTRIERMKENSFPYRQAFTRLLRGLNEKQEISGMNLYVMLGLIEAQFGTSFSGISDDDAMFNVSITDSEAADFIRRNSKENETTLKNIVIRILQFCLMLNANGYPSFDSITTCVMMADYSQQGLFNKTQKTVPEIAKAIEYGIAPRAKRAKRKETPKTSKKQLNKYGFAIKKSKVNKTNKMPDIKEPITKDKVLEESKNAIRQLERKEKLTQDIIDKTDKLHETVKTNSALSDFL